MYDFVWGSETWKEDNKFENINYLTESTWDEKFKECGFIIDQSPQYNINPKYNPFNKYIKSYKKILLDELYKSIIDN